MYDSTIIMIHVMVTSVWLCWYYLPVPLIYLADSQAVLATYHVILKSQLKLNSKHYIAC